MISLADVGKWKVQILIAEVWLGVEDYQHLRQLVPKRCGDITISQ